MKVYRWTDGKTDGQTRQTDKTDRQRDGRRKKKYSDKLTWVFNPEKLKNLTFNENIFVVLHVH